MSLPFQGDDWLPGFNFNVEEWDEKGLHYETLAICRSLALAHSVQGCDHREASQAASAGTTILTAIRQSKSECRDGTLTFAISVGQRNGFPRCNHLVRFRQCQIFQHKSRILLNANKA
jgi:hypothetical protein